MRVFLDANVLIRLGRGEPDTEGAIRQLCTTHNVTFYTSDLLRLEVIPKAIFHRKIGEIAYYGPWFKQAESIPIVPALLARAEEITIQYGLSALDAAHSAAAESVGALLVTQEKRDRPLHRVPVVKHLEDI